MSTLGERRVRTEFNPSKDSVVDKIKQDSAKLIDLVDQFKGTNPEQARCAVLAQTAYEEAAMWAVKAATA